MTTPRRISRNITVDPFSDMNKAIRGATLKAEGKLYVLVDNLRADFYKYATHQINCEGQHGGDCSCGLDEVKERWA